jgi:hypothetical protein
MSSSETERLASDMSDLSYEQELGEISEGGEVDVVKAPCNTVAST